eukprot:403337290
MELEKQNQTSIQPNKMEFKNMIEDYISSVKKDVPTQFNFLFKTDQKQSNSINDNYNHNESQSPGHETIKQTPWQQLFKNILRRNSKLDLNLKSSQEVTEAVKQLPLEKINSKFLLDMESSMNPQNGFKAPLTTKNQQNKQFFSYSNSNMTGANLDLQQKDIEDIYIDYGYTRKKRAVYQDMLKQQSKGNKFFLRQIKLDELGDQTKKKKLSFIKINQQNIRDGSEKVRIVNQTLSDKNFSKNYLKERLGNQHYKQLIMNKVSQVGNNLQQNIHIQKETLNPEIPFYNSMNDFQFKKSWSVRSLRNSNVIVNPHSNFYHTIKEKQNDQAIHKEKNKLLLNQIGKSGNRFNNTQKRQTSQRNNHMPLFKSPTLRFKEESVKLQKDKLSMKNLQMSERQKTVQRIKQTFEENYLSNVLKNVDQGLFMFKQASTPLLGQRHSEITPTD